tara:strand:- start:1311 stop:2345 length:1035 start_codon:yes stop_codon:yes gene_type:complete
MRRFSRIIFIIIIYSNSLFAVNDEVILAENFPRTLSEFNFFKSLNQQIPEGNVIPYELISSLFSDYSQKLRFVYVPEGKEAIYRKDSVFNFPVGSALVKTFLYPVDERDSSLGINLLETRVLLKKESGWEAVSYVWNKEQDEAFIKIAGKAIYTSWIDKAGEERKVRYKVPNKNECKECHASNDVMTPIGPKARNLNKDFTYGDGIENQLYKWLELSLIKDYPKDLVGTVNWEDVDQDLNLRARAYLDINCGHCHAPLGAANSTGLYLNYSEKRPKHFGVYKSPVATGRGSGNLKYSIVPGHPEESILLLRMFSTDPGIMMPEAGRSLAHEEAVFLIEEWIKSM